MPPEYQAVMSGLRAVHQSSFHEQKSHSGPHTGTNAYRLNCSFRRLVTSLWLPGMQSRILRSSDLPNPEHKLLRDRGLLLNALISDVPVTLKLREKPHSPLFPDVDAHLRAMTQRGKCLTGGMNTSYERKPCRATSMIARVCCTHLIC